MPCHRLPILRRGLCLWQTPAWLEQMIAHTTWRDLFYKLAEAHPDCLMLNFTVKVGRVLESREEDPLRGRLGSSRWGCQPLPSSPHTEQGKQGLCVCSGCHIGSFRVGHSGV